MQSLWESRERLLLTNFLVSDKVPSAMRIGNVIRKWRTMSEMSQREACKAIGVSLPTLSRIERGNPPDGETLRRLLLWLMSKENENGNQK